MVRPIVRDILFLSQKSAPATRDDLASGLDLLDTLAAHAEHCVGLAGNMIGVKKRIIAVNMGPCNVLMFNPVIVQKEAPYETTEGCLSLAGQRKATRYDKLVLEYEDMRFQKQRRTFTGWTAQIIQHELDHLEGILI